MPIQIGVNGTSREVVGMYVGDENGVARKVVKGYVGGPKKLNAYSWEEIKNIIQNGGAQEIFAIGDSKSFTISSPSLVGGIDVSGNYNAVILGHNQNPEDTIATHFEIFSEEQMPISFIGSNDFSFNMSGTNKNWDLSYIYTTICPNFKSILPIDLQNAIFPITKQTRRGNGSGGYITRESVNEVFILSRREMDMNDTPYSFYQNTESQEIIKYNYLDKITPTSAWLRDAGSATTAPINIIRDTGGFTTTTSTTGIRGVSFCFAIG